MVRPAHRARVPSRRARDASRARGRPSRARPRTAGAPRTGAPAPPAPRALPAAGRAHGRARRRRSPRGRRRRGRRRRTGGPGAPNGSPRRTSGRARRSRRARSRRGRACRGPRRRRGWPRPRRARWDRRPARRGSCPRRSRVRCARPLRRRVRPPRRPRPARARWRAAGRLRSWRLHRERAAHHKATMSRMASVTIVEADNLAFLRGEPAGAYRLIYVDPPFNTGAKRELRRLRTVRDAAGDRTGFGGARYLTTEVGRRSYADRFDDYLGFLAPRLEEAWRVLASDGSLFVHLDPRESHYVKVFLDGLCGRD